MRMRLGAALLALLVLAGCAGAPADPAEPSPSVSPTSSASSSSPGSNPTSTSPPQPDTLILLLTRSFDYERTSGNGTGPGFYRAHHCGEGGYTREPLEVRVVDYPNDYSRTSSQSGSQDPWQPSGLLFMEWDREASTDKPVMTTGWGPTIDGFDADAGAFVVPPAFGSSSVANVTATHGTVAVEGHALQAGAPYTRTATYTYTDYGTTYRVTETLVFELLGMGGVRVEYRGHACI